MAAQRDGILLFLDDEYEPVETEHGTCTRIVHGNNWKSTHEAATATEPAAVVDGSGYAARLVVLPSFGCVLHEEKR